MCSLPQRQIKRWPGLMIVVALLAALAGAPAGQAAAIATVLKDINAKTTTASSSPGGLTAVGSTLYFAADDGSHGEELWKSDGRPDGTTLVKDIWPGVGSSAPRQLANVKGTLIFTADDGSHGYELWKSDGTTAGTALVQDLRPGQSSSLPYGFTAAGAFMFFSANSATAGVELWSAPLPPMWFRVYLPLVKR